MLISSNIEPKTLHREPSPPPCKNKENDNLSEGGEKAVIEKPNPNEIHAKKNKGEKSTNSGSNNSNNNKRSSSTEDKKTLLAQKYYITSLENRINDLQDNVALLNSIKDSKLEPTLKDCHQSVNANAEGYRETSGASLLRSVDNKLYMFETQLINNMNLQNQLNFQNYMNIQNQLSILNMQTQISQLTSTHIPPNNIYGHHNLQYSYYQNRIPSMNPIQHIPVFPQQVQPAVNPTQPVMMTHQPTVIPTQPVPTQPVMIMHQPTVIQTPVAVPPPPNPRQIPQTGYQMPMQPGTYPPMQPNGARQPQMTRLQTPYIHVQAPAQHHIPTQPPRNDGQRNASFNQMSNQHVPLSNKPECAKTEKFTVTSPVTKNEVKASDYIEHDVIVIPASPVPRPTDYI